MLAAQSCLLVCKYLTFSFVLGRRSGAFYHSWNEFAIIQALCGERGYVLNVNRIS
jgi:hypothetical protein